MSIKMSLNSPELNQQIELLKVYPEIAQKNFRPALEAGTGMLFTRIQPSIPVLSGNAQRTFKKSVLGSGATMQGRVGWWGANQPWYINVVEYGRRKRYTEYPKPPHQFLKIGETFVRETHPGPFGARQFMRSGFEQMQPAIAVRMQLAADQTLKDLEVNP